MTHNDDTNATLDYCDHGQRWGEVRFDELDPNRIGSVLVNVLWAAVLAGHERVSGTVTSYLARTSQRSGEVEFVHDLLLSMNSSGPTVEEIADKWFGENGRLTMGARMSFPPPSKPCDCGEV